VQQLEAEAPRRCDRDAGFDHVTSIEVEVKLPTVSLHWPLPAHTERWQKRACDLATRA
jgi:hypothetical protein